MVMIIVDGELLHPPASCLREGSLPGLQNCLLLVQNFSYLDLVLFAGHSEDLKVH